MTIFMRSTLYWDIHKCVCTYSREFCIKKWRNVQVLLTTTQFLKTYNLLSYSHLKFNR